MPDSVDTQLWRLSVLFVLGTGCNVLFHFYTAARAVLHPGRILRHLYDGIVAILALGSVLAVVFIVSYGEMRLYIPVSITAGFLASQVFLGQLLYSLFHATFEESVKALKWIKKHIIVPFISAIKWLFRPLYSWMSPPKNPPGPKDTKGVPPEEPPDMPPEEHLC